MPEHSIVAPKLDSIFYPQSIAVVGASTRPGTVGNDIFRNLLFAEFNGLGLSGQPEGQVDCWAFTPIASLAEIPAASRSGRADRARLRRCWAWSTRRSPRA